MQNELLDLPRNSTFGIFLASVLLLAGIYCHFTGLGVWMYVFCAAAFIVIIVVKINADALMPLNKLWSNLGVLMGAVVSPVVIGVIYFGMFTPLSLAMRLIGRDELRVNVAKQRSYWVEPLGNGSSTSFKNQF